MKKFFSDLKEGNYVRCVACLVALVLCDRNVVRSSFRENAYEESQKGEATVPR